MRYGWTWIGLVGSFMALAAPVAAQSCQTGATPFCDALDEAGFNRLFGDYADVGALFVGLFVLLLLLSGLIAMFRRGSTSPKLRADVRQSEVAVGPGGTVQLLADVENARRRTSVDVVAEWDELPPEWGAQSFAAVAYPSGFTSPQVVTTEDPLHLSSQGKGHHRATVALQLTAPDAVSFDEVIEIEVRLVPVTGGVRRPGRAAPAKFTVRLTTKAPAVEIQDVNHMPASIVAGRPVRTLARLFNQGEADARDVGVSLHLNDEAVDQKIVSLLAPRQSADVEFEWTPRAGENRIRIALA